MEDNLQKKAEQLAQDCAAAKAEAAAAKQEATAMAAELKAAQTNIDNLDKSIKDQQATIDELKAAKAAMNSGDARSQFKAALYAQKDFINKMASSKTDKFALDIELKTDPTSIGTGNVTTNNWYGVEMDPTIHAAAPVANAFIAVFGIRPVGGNKLSWIEKNGGNGNVGYVAELAQNTNQVDFFFQEKTRKMAKIAAYLTLSTEMEDWMDQLYNWCVNEGNRMIDAKIDAELATGNGHDSDHPTNVYGVVGQATAFSALAALAIEDATVADVILDSVNQIAKEGYNANVAFVTWATFAELRGLKNAAGNYLYNEALGMLGPVRIFPTSRLSSGTLLVADSNCVQVKGGNSYEIEFIRNGAYDAYDVYLRKRVQCVVPTPEKKGLIYVSNIGTAKAALSKASPLAAIAGVMDDVHNTTTHAITTDEAS